MKYSVAAVAALGVVASAAPAKRDDGSFHLAAVRPDGNSNTIVGVCNAGAAIEWVCTSDNSAGTFQKTAFNFVADPNATAPGSGTLTYDLTCKQNPPRENP